MESTEKKINQRGAVEEAKVGRVEVKLGWVYLVEAEDESAWDCSKEFDGEGGEIFMEYCRYGYHGGDIQPCGAEWVADSDTEGFLVLADTDDPAEIDTVDGFTLTPWEEEIDYGDGAGTTKTVWRHGHEHVLALVY